MDFYHFSVDSCMSRYIDPKVSKTPKKLITKLVILRWKWGFRAYKSKSLKKYFVYFESAVWSRVDLYIICSDWWEKNFPKISDIIYYLGDHPKPLCGWVQKIFINETYVIRFLHKHWFRIYESFFIKLSLHRTTNGEHHIWMVVTWTGSSVKTVKIPYNKFHMGYQLRQVSIENSRKYRWPSFVVSSFKNLILFVNRPILILFVKVLLQGKMILFVNRQKWDFL